MYVLVNSWSDGQATCKKLLLYASYHGVEAEMRAKYFSWPNMYFYNGNVDISQQLSCCNPSTKSIWIHEGKK